MRPDGRRAARQRDGHADSSRRSADAGRRRDSRTPSGWPSKERRASRRFRCCRSPTRDAQPLLAALAGPDGPRGLARRACRSPITSGPGPAKVHLKVAFELGHQAGLRRHRPDSGRGPIRTSGSSAATTTTPGSTAPRTRSPAMVALLEEARALGELREAGLEAEAHHRLLRLGRRGARCCSARPNGPRRTPRNCDSTPSPTSTPTATAAATSAWAGSHTLRALHQRRRAGRRRIPRAKSSGVEARAARRHRRGQVRRGAQGDPRSAPTCASTPSGRAPTTPLSSTTSASPRLNLGFGGEDDGGIYHSIYDDFYWYTHFSDTDFVYGRALAQTVGLGRAASGGRRAAALRVRRPRRHDAEYVKEL